MIGLIWKSYNSPVIRQKFSLQETAQRRFWHHLTQGFGPSLLWQGPAAATILEASAAKIILQAPLIFDRFRIYESTALQRAEFGRIFSKFFHPNEITSSSPSGLIRLFYFAIYIAKRAASPPLNDGAQI